VSAPAGGPTQGEPVGLVDHVAVARRLRRWLLLLGLAVPGVWVVGGLLTGGPRLTRLAELAGAALLLAVLVEAVVVGGAAAAGALRAGARGERLAGADVRLLPPQVVDRLRRRGPGSAG
jgi:hypothetical protein